MKSVVGEKREYKSRPLVMTWSSFQSQKTARARQRGVRGRRSLDKDQSRSNHSPNVGLIDSLTTKIVDCFSLSSVWCPTWTEGVRKESTEMRDVMFMIEPAVDMFVEKSWEVFRLRVFSGCRLPCRKERPESSQVLETDWSDTRVVTSGETIDR